MTTMLLKLRNVVLSSKDNVTTPKSGKKSSRRFAAGTDMVGFSYTAAMNPMRIAGL